MILQAILAVLIALGAVAIFSALALYDWVFMAFLGIMLAILVLMSAWLLAGAVLH